MVSFSILVFSEVFIGNELCKFSHRPRDNVYDTIKLDFRMARDFILECYRSQFPHSTIRFSSLNRLLMMFLEEMIHM